MKLVVGLGNPGSDYRETYHNIGFTALDMLAVRLNARGFAFDKKSGSELAECSSTEKILLCKPQTYMNLSGDAVSYLSRYYKIESRNIIVVYDDIEMRKGTVRARLGGSAGTHNGMRDIVAKLGSDFARVRIGIGVRPDYMGLADYVLSRVPVAERPLMDGACALACDYISDWLDGREWRELTTSVK